MVRREELAFGGVRPKTYDTTLPGKILVENNDENPTGLVLHSDVYRQTAKFVYGKTYNELQCRMKIVLDASTGQ